MLLFPCHPLYPRRPDEHFEPEVEAARALGARVAFFDHDTLAVPRLEEPALLRSWMLSADRYAQLRAPLVTSPEQYRRAHELPGWYETFHALTPATVFDLAEAGSLPPGPGVLKDYVKSLKHLWNQACFVPDVHDQAAVERVARAFREARGEDLQGAVVLRGFEPFKGPEARSWWVRGKCMLVTAHPDTPDEAPGEVPVATAAEAVQALDCPFVTVDWALNDSETWRVVEVGDGQVSDRPVSTSAEAFLGAVLGAFGYASASCVAGSTVSVPSASTVTRSPSERSPPRIAPVSDFSSVRRMWRCSGRAP
jgi:hypothetical protein